MKDRIKIKYINKCQIGIKCTESNSLGYSKKSLLTTLWYIATTPCTSVSD